ncbi:MAG: hypothetical protein ACQEQT_08635 [Chloroflexota bacterium]
MRVQFRRQNQCGETWQIRALTLSGGIFVSTDWYTITVNDPHWIEIDWPLTRTPTLAYTLIAPKRWKP